MMPFEYLYSVLLLVVVMPIGRVSSGFGSVVFTSRKNASETEKAGGGSTWDRCWVTASNG
jgi:hypothetical protein